MQPMTVRLLGATVPDPPHAEEGTKYGKPIVPAEVTAAFFKKFRRQKVVIAYTLL